jgi:hypothetical protein
MGCRLNPRLALHAFRKKTPLSISWFNVSWPGRFGSGLRKCFETTSRRRRAQIDTIEAWWMEERGKCRAKDRKWIDGLICTVGYALWKNRNAEVFRSSARSRTPTIIATDIVDECKMMCHLWRAQRGVGVGDNSLVVRE